MEDGRSVLRSTPTLHFTILNTPLTHSTFLCVRSLLLMRHSLLSPLFSFLFLLPAATTDRTDTDLEYLLLSINPQRLSQSTRPRSPVRCALLTPPTTSSPARRPLCSALLVDPPPPLPPPPLPPPPLPASLSGARTLSSRARRSRARRPTDLTTTSFRRRRRETNTTERRPSRTVPLPSACRHRLGRTSAFYLTAAACPPCRCCIRSRH